MNTRRLRQELKYKIPELKLALIRERSSSSNTFEIITPEDVHHFVEPLKHMAEEHVLAFHLDARNHAIGFHQVSHGTLTASLVHPREVFKAALLSNAFSVIVAHNHPGGSLKPSDDDLATTEQLIQAGKLLGVPVLDHIIVSFKGITSIRQTNPLLWSQ